MKAPRSDLADWVEHHAPGTLNKYIGTEGGTFIVNGKTIHIERAKPPPIQTNKSMKSNIKLILGVSIIFAILLNL